MVWAKSSGERSSTYLQTGSNSRRNLGGTRWSTSLWICLVDCFVRLSGRRFRIDRYISLFLLFYSLREKNKSHLGAHYFSPPSRSRSRFRSRFRYRSRFTLVKIRYTQDLVKVLIMDRPRALLQGLYLRSWSRTSSRIRSSSSSQIRSRYRSWFS